MNLKKIVIFSLAVWLAVAVFLPTAPAQAQVQRGFDGLKTFVLKQTPVFTPQAAPLRILTQVINILLSLLAVLAVLAIVAGGLMYILSFGDENRASLAKKIIWYAIVGLIIAILSALIINILLSLAGGQYTPDTGNEGSQNPPSENSPGSGSSR